jgi:acetyltransferase-like isoleucine patch superfamily enzyme
LKSESAVSIQQDELLREFSELVDTGRLIGRGDKFFNDASSLVDGFLSTGALSVADDPFRGDDRRLAEDSDLYYVMFWRLFDQTPAAMMQDFAIKVRRILARRVFKRCGSEVVLHHNVLFSSGRNIELGDGVFINRNVMLDDRTTISIGDHTMVAAGALIETHGHIYDDFSQPIMHAGRTLAPVSIGSDCLIGFNTAIMAGTTVGERCIVAANSVVTKDVPDRTIVGGVPARKIKEIVPRAG